MTGPAERRPNVVVVLTDQQTADAMGCVGNADLHTPAVDSLAANGTLFRNAYCTQPLCSPSRASLVTGEMPHRNGVTNNVMTLDEGLRGRELGTLFDAAGYDTAYAGKWHLPEYDLTGDHGFRRVYGFGDDTVAANCVEFLGEERDQPFLLVASFDNPHNICEWARDEPLPWGDVDEVPTRDCPSLPSNFPVPPYEPELLRLVQDLHPRWHPTRGWDEYRWRQYRNAYYRLCERVDAEIGKVLTALRDQGLEDDTVVVFSSDHGDGVGAHRWNQKWALYEESVRVPMIVSWRGVTRAGAIDDEHLVSNGLDLLPTVLDYAGIRPPVELPGLSLRLLADGAAVTGWRDEVVARTEWDHEALAGSTGRMLRTARYKYVAYSWGRYREQLFDLREDPGEMVNLAVAARYDDVLAEHRRRLTDWCRKEGDDFVVPA